MTRLDEVMMDKTLSNVSKMIYSSVYVATGGDEVLLTLDGFERMYASVVTDAEKSVAECFDELLSKGLIAVNAEQDNGVTVYRLIRCNATRDYSQLAVIPGFLFWRRSIMKELGFIRYGEMIRTNVRHLGLCNHVHLDRL